MNHTTVIFTYLVLLLAYTSSWLFAQQTSPPDDSEVFMLEEEFANDYQPLFSEDALAPLYPGCQPLEYPPSLQETLIEFPLKEIDCQMYSCPVGIEKMEDFYRSRYPNASVIKLQFLEVFYILRIKFREHEKQQQVEVSLYTSPYSQESSLWQKMANKIEKRLQRRDKMIATIAQGIKDLQTSLENQIITEETLQEKKKELAMRHKLLMRSRSFWDFTAIDQLLAQQSNILLIAAKKPSSQNKPSSEQPSTPEISAKEEEKVEPEKSLQQIIPNLLAKDISYLVYPQSTLVEHKEIEQVLPRTAEQIQVYQSTFICKGTSEKVEEFYRARYPELSALKVSAFGVFQILKLKFFVPEINSELQIAFYSLMIGRNAPRWDEEKETIEERLAELEAPVKELEREMKSLQELARKKEISPTIAESRIQALEKRKHFLTTNPSYLDITAMEKVMTINKNIMVMTQVKNIEND